MDKQDEDPELDFTDFISKQKETPHETAIPVATEQKKAIQQKKPLPTVVIRGIIFFAILLLLMGALIFLYLNRPEQAALEAPEGYRVINDSTAPPRIEKIK